MRYLYLYFVLAAGIIPLKGAFLEQLTPRDSILIADHLCYGFELDDIALGTSVRLPDLSRVLNDTLVLVRDWSLDTLRAQRNSPSLSLRGHIVIAPFEEGRYTLPPLSVLLTPPGAPADTLVFEALEMEVKSMPVDTATFEIHDLKGQIRYPLTFRELLPYMGGALLLGGLLASALVLLARRRRDSDDKSVRDPAYIVALRKLEQYRGEKYWADDKQKIFYSGITDALREYIADRFGIDAREMTTGEIFSHFKQSGELPADLYSQTLELFELADFVKFAKHTATPDQNARSIPSAVRFVMDTCRPEEPLESDNQQEEPTPK